MPEKVLLYLVRQVLLTRLRGTSRLVILLANKNRVLRQAPFLTPEGKRIWVDLRLCGGQALFSGDGIAQESNEKSIVKQLVQRGSVVFDIGAHFGIYTALFSTLVGSAGRVHAFEPNPALYHCLERTVAGLGNATLQKVALGDQICRCNFFVPEEASMASFRYWTSEGGRVHRLVVVQDTLDHLVNQEILQVPDFIKCDVEGAESMVFRGGERLLNRQGAPIILFEANLQSARAYGNSACSAAQYLGQLPRPHYSCFIVGKDSLMPLEESVLPKHSMVLAVPASRRTIISDYV